MSAVITPPRITSGDRLGVTMFVALALHSLLILGVSFNRQDPDKRNAPPLSMEITLVQSSQKDAPKNADYLAQGEGPTSGTYATHTIARIRFADEPGSDPEEP